MRKHNEDGSLRLAYKPHIIPRWGSVRLFVELPSGWPISRILSGRFPCLCNHLSGRCVAAPLIAAYPGLALPTRGKGTYGDEQSPIVHGRFRPCLALLPAGVTWPSALRQMPVVSYTTFSPSPSSRRREGCLFLWPFSGRFTPHGGFPAPGAIRRRALWSADFPRSRQRRTAIAQPA
jgi:hypothetical protein